MSPEREVLREFRKWSGWDPEVALGRKSAQLVSRFLWLEKSRLSQCSYLGRRLAVLRFCRYWAERGLKLTRLPEEELRGYLEFRNAGGGFSRPLARRTFNGELWSVRAFLAWLIASDEAVLVGELPGGLRKSKGKRRMGRALEVEEIEAWFGLCDLGDVWGIRDRAFFELAYGTGLRLSEVLGLELSDVNFAEGEVRVGKSKNGDGRMVPLTERAAGWLRRYLETSRPELPFVRRCRALLWCNERGQALTSASVHKRISGLYATRLVFGDRIGMHALRHSYATHLVRAGAGSEAVRRLLGHRQMNSTAIYTSIKVEDLRDVLKGHPRVMDITAEGLSSR
jgi:integrase/recombinase XerD